MSKKGEPRPFRGWFLVLAILALTFARSAMAAAADSQVAAAADQSAQGDTTSKDGDPGPKWAVLGSPVDDIELSVERSLGERWAWRMFYVYQRRGFYEDPEATRNGGGIGFKRFWFRGPRLSGLFWEGHLSAYGVHVAYNGWENDKKTGPVPDFLMYGGGTQLGWQFALGSFLRLAPGVNVDWLIPGVGAVEYLGKEGRINLVPRVFVGVAF